MPCTCTAYSDFLSVDGLYNMTLDIFAFTYAIKNLEYLVNYKAIQVLAHIFLGHTWAICLST